MADSRDATDEIARALADRRRALEAELGITGERLGDIRAARADTVADDEHDPEGPTLAAEWSRAEGQRADTLSELADLEAAEARLAAGTYGVCEGCGRSIPPARLAVRPAARRCVACAEGAGR
ncbi:RNA polymerase-binding transcription factor DksA [Microbacterium lemovicicum]|uniref:RNA polymerase-binding transcription factor DksA n=1 Tax=Microbacterium lemovicicum TaxID=1072463 RepID=A0A3S9W9J5_9MICO|nr:TraR/DksA C4-type zinc finger protein [Microbacterium lemovicicum]AZS36603.1 RNA polymerase-binding transcription factor DksA [Microbacterium lemovicicum]